jgi:4-aminobutyrate aminotransferase/(S)-3-amino-2-methylpropionate transaminase
MAKTDNDNSSLLRARTEWVAPGVTSAHSIFAVRAQGCQLWDANGKEYLDFAAGIGVVNVGHNHPRVVAAVRGQLDRYVHTCFQVVMYEPYIRLAQRLCQLVGGNRPMKAFFATTGAEAVENAIKIARAATRRSAVIAFDGAFHGRTLLGMSLTGISAPYKQRFGPFAPDIHHAPYPYEYRGWTTERALEGLQELFDSEVSPDRVAAILIEPELGDGGFVPAPAAYMRRLREITDEHGIVLICDEIQTGFGRTGRMFGFEHSGIEPDIVTVAKGLANGFPMSAVIGRAHLMDAPEPGGLGGTYGGNPLGCAAAMAVLDVFEEEALLERAGRLADILREGLVKIRNAHDCVGDIRGLGPMLAMEIVSDRQTKEPDAALTGTILEQARERGLIVIRCGTHRNVVRLLAPLVASDDEARRGMRILAEAVEASVTGRRGAEEKSYA